MYLLSFNNLRKFIPATLLLFSLTTLIISGQQKFADKLLYERSPVFKDQFDNNNNNWITDNTWIKGNFEKGFYTITCKNYHNQTGLTYKTIPFDQEKDYEIESSFKVLRGSGALAFGITKNFDHYRVELESKKNNLNILKDSPQKNKIEVLFSSPLKSGINPDISDKITIRKISGNYFILFNNEQLCQLNNIDPAGEQIGYNVGLNSEISVDYLNISYLASQISPVMLGKSPASFLITWVSPSAITTTLDTYTARIKANIRSGSELKSVLFYVNGASRGESEIKPSQDRNGHYMIEKTITLNPGDNNVYLVATNIDGSTKSDLRYFINPPANPPIISWGNPPIENVMVNTDKITIEACIESSTELRSTKILVNGDVQGENNVFQASGINKCDYKWQRSVVLKKGENSVYIVATNVAGSTTSDKRTIKYEPTSAEKRIALIVGNSDYLNGVNLKNPENDANLMEGTLKDLGFNVIKRINIGRDSMLTSIREFSRKLSSCNVALFYYAGHGIQVEGINYLIPTDAKLNDKEDCKWEAVAVSTVTDELKKYNTNTNIVILDACRNNPYRSWARGEEQGFKALGPINGTIISFATSEGATAADGSGSNGLFTEELTKQMNIPQPIESVFKNTRKQVMERSKGLQTPVEWSYMTGDFYFKK